MIIGLTGNIAAGKSTVAKMFGWPVVDADQLSREVMEDNDILFWILGYFGKDVFNDGGILNRKALGEIVFLDSIARNKLEEVVHPAISKVAQQRFQELHRRGHDIIIYEAALLVETGRHKEMDKLILVRTEDHVRLQRLMARSNLSIVEACMRMNSQMSQELKEIHADYVIDNSDSLEKSLAQVKDVMEKIKNVQ